MSINSGSDAVNTAGVVNAYTTLFQGQVISGFVL